MRSKRLLIIEDDNTLRESLNRGFTRDGFEVSTAPSAEEGLGLVLGGLFDAILVDLKLPRNDGAEFSHRVRAMGCRSEIILMSGADVDPEETAIAAGARAMVPKGADFFDRVRATVGSVLSTRTDLPETA